MERTAGADGRRFLVVPPIEAAQIQTLGWLRSLKNAMNHEMGDVPGDIEWNEPQAREGWQNVMLYKHYVC